MVNKIDITIVIIVYLFKILYYYMHRYCTYTNVRSIYYSKLKSYGIYLIRLNSK